MHALNGKSTWLGEYSRTRVHEYKSLLANFYDYAKWLTPQNNIHRKFIVNSFTKR
jgi:hypothetical protein